MTGCPLVSVPSFHSTTNFACAFRRQQRITLKYSSFTNCHNYLFFVYQYQMITHLTPCPLCSPMTTWTISLYLSNPASVEEDKWAVIRDHCAGTIQEWVLRYNNYCVEFTRRIVGLVLMGDVLLLTVCNDKNVLLNHFIQLNSSGYMFYSVHVAHVSFFLLQGIQPALFYKWQNILSTLAWHARG